MNIFDSGEQSTSSNIPHALKQRLLPWAMHQYIVYAQGYLLLQQYQHARFTLQFYHYRLAETVSLQYALRQSCYVLTCVLHGSIILENTQGQGTHLVTSMYLLHTVADAGVSLKLLPGDYEMMLYLINDDFATELGNSEDNFKEIFNTSQARNDNAWPFAVKANYIVQDIVDKIKNHGTQDLGVDVFIGLLSILKQYKAAMTDTAAAQALPYVIHKDKLVEIRKKIIAEPNRNLHQLQRLSKQYNIPEKKLRVAFRQLFNMELTDFLMQQIMERAKYSLERSNKTIDSIALELGYENGANLAKAFKRYTQFSPGAYRARAGWQERK